MNGRERRVRGAAGRWRQALIGALLVAALGGPVHAAEYEIEVIVFRQEAAQSAGAWRAADTLPNFGAARRLRAPTAEPDANAAPESAAFTSLPPTALRLAGVEKLLNGSPAYEVVAHVGWRQPDAATEPVYIADETAPDGFPAHPRAEGTVRLRAAGSEIRVDSDFVVLADETPVRVQARRNVRGGELHYLDHELLGILLQVTPVAADPATELSD